MQMASRKPEKKENEKIAEECKALMATEEELAENDAKVLLPLMEKFGYSYDKKAEGVSDKEWLKRILKEELSYKTDEEIERDAEEIISALKKLEGTRTEINEYCDNGGTKENWLSNKISEACTGMEVAAFGEYLSSIDEVLASNNALMADTICIKGANIINQNPQLHGFIAEQYHANTFNSNAALKGSPLRAEVLKPAHGYAKDSVDIVIKDTNNSGKIIERYQVKYGKDAKVTAELIKKGNYSNQRVLVAEGQKNAVASDLTTKSVDDKIGGNSKTEGITSEALSKEDAIKMQRKAQEKGKIPGKESWNSYNTKKLAYNIGRQAVIAGVSAAALTVGIDTAAKLVQGKKINPAESMELAIRTGVDTGAKVTTAAAIKVGMEKGVLKLIPKAVGGIGVAVIADAAIENAKVAYKVAKGDMSITQGLDAMGRGTCGCVGSFAGGIEGSAAAALTVATLISNPIGILAVGVAGLVAGSIAGNAVGQAVYSGAKTIVKGAVKCVKSVGSTISRGVSKVASFLFG